MNGTTTIKTQSASQNCNTTACCGNGSCDDGNGGRPNYGESCSNCSTDCGTCCVPATCPTNSNCPAFPDGCGNNLTCASSFSASGTGCGSCPWGVRSVYNSTYNKTYSSCWVPQNKCLYSAFSYNSSLCGTYGNGCWDPSSVCFPLWDPNVTLWVECSNKRESDGYVTNLSWQISASPISGTVSCLLTYTCPELLVESSQGGLAYQNNILKGNILPDLETVRLDKIRQRLSSEDKLVIREANPGDVTYLNSFELVGLRSSQGKTQIYADQDSRPVGFNEEDLRVVAPMLETVNYFDYRTIRADKNEGYYLYLKGGITTKWRNNLREIVLKKLIHPRLYEWAPKFVKSTGTNLSFYANITIEVEENGRWEKIKLPSVLILENSETKLVKLPAGVSRARVRTVQGVYDFEVLAVLPVAKADLNVTQKTFAPKNNQKLSLVDKDYLEIDSKTALRISVMDLAGAGEVVNYDSFYIRTSGYYLYGKQRIENMKKTTLGEDLKFLYRLWKIRGWLSEPEKYIKEIVEFGELNR